MNLFDFTTPEMDWMDSLRRNAEVTASVFNIPPQMLGELMPQIPHFVQDIKSVYGTSTDHIAWACTMKAYNKIRWFVHVGKVHPEPQRKLRKCQLRKRYRVLRRERRRFL